VRHAARQFTLPVVAGVLVLTGGCAPYRKAVQSPQGTSPDRGAFVLNAETLGKNRGSVLEAMVGRVPSLHVQRRGGECPSVALRSAVAGAVPASGPLVYVDGARTTDTCVLDMMQSHDTDRVEVYPQGYTNRPGYARHAQGLILVFTRSG
jgi:hypothetical protein